MVKKCKVTYDNTKITVVALRKNKEFTHSVSYILHSWVLFKILQ